MARRILMVSTVPVTIERFLSPLAGYLRQCGWVVEGAARDLELEHGGFPHLSARHSIPWSRSPGLGNMTKAVLRFRELLRKHEYDVLHLNTPIASFLARTAITSLRPTQRPGVVYTAHGLHFFQGGSVVRNAGYSVAERLVGSVTDRLVVMNEEDYRAVARLKVVPAHRLAWIPGIGIDIAAFVDEARASSVGWSLRRELGVDSAAPLFLIIGEFNPGKRHEDAIFALAKAFPNEGHLVFAGQGPLERHLRGVAGECGVSGRVHFLGYRRDVPRLLRDASALLMPSEREGLPRSVMEAMAVACPVVGADARGTRDLLGGGAGLLYPTGDRAALGAAMRRIVGDPGLRRECVVMASKRIALHSSDMVYPMYRRLFEEVARERGRS